jgi:molybdopterin-synthase adenylyltransferase
MADTERLHAILRAVDDLGLFQGSRVVDVPLTGYAAMEGEVQVEGQSVLLRLVLDSSFPLSLPLFLLRPWDALGFIPHVDQTGLVCYLDHEGLVLDRRRPVQLVQDALERAVGVLADGVTGRNRSDFADEFEVYWNRWTDGMAALSMLNPDDEARRIAVASENGKQFYIGSSVDDLSAFWNGRDIGRGLTVEEGLYLPLEQGTILVPPSPAEPFWTVEDVRRALLPGLSPPNRAKLHGLITGLAAQTKYVIAKLPRPSGGESLFGLRYDGVGGEHPLLETGTAKLLIPLQIERRDQAYLVQRGGGDLRLASKHVLLVGCGAVGGHLAFELARGGILHLTLLDPDMLIPENSFRHALGRGYWRLPKAEALRLEITNRLPYVRVRAVIESIERALAGDSVNLAEYDLIVLATGNPTVELEVNERLHALRDGPVGLFTWLEPLGIGGHALLVRNAPGGGCFECLYTPMADDEEVLVNRAAFAAPGQSFGRALSGCGSLHTPYGSMDAQRTVVLAAQLAIDVLTGAEQGNPLLSWKGNPTAFTAAGFRLSHRFDATEEQLSRYRYEYRSPRCPVCGTQSGRNRR